MAEERKDMHADCRSIANLYWIERYMVGILLEIAVELQGKIRSQTWQFKVGERKEKLEQWSRRVWIMYIPERIKIAECCWKKTFFLWFWEHVHSHFLLDIKKWAEITCLAKEQVADQNVVKANSLKTYLQDGTANLFHSLKANISDIYKIERSAWIKSFSEKSA